MVYISSDGTICQSAPWGMDRLTKLFFGVIAFVVFFFKTLFGLDVSTEANSGRSGGSSFRGWGSGGSGGGGGGGGNRPFRPGGGGPNRRIMTMKDVNPPTIGGCPGGACGM